MICTPYYKLEYEYSEIKHVVSLEFTATAVNKVELIDRGAKRKQNDDIPEQGYYVYYLMQPAKSGSRYYAAVTRRGFDRIIASSDRRLIGLSVKAPRFVSTLPTELMKP